jgi:hypothetical protein
MQLQSPLTEFLMQVAWMLWFLLTVFLGKYIYERVKKLFACGRRNI